SRRSGRALDAELDARKAAVLDPQIARGPATHQHPFLVEAITLGPFAEQLHQDDERPSRLRARALFRRRGTGAGAHNSCTATPGTMRHLNRLGTGEAGSSMMGQSMPRPPRLASSTEFWNRRVRETSA